jgi:hypothetical protein
MSVRPLELSVPNSSVNACIFTFNLYFLNSSFNTLIPELGSVSTVLVIAGDFFAMDAGFSKTIKLLFFFPSNYS